MISGYEPGTEVKWNLENVLTTGVVQRVFRQSQDIQVNGQHFHVEVSDHSPSYLIRHHSGRYVVLPHVEVMLKRSNVHT